MLGPARVRREGDAACGTLRARLPLILAILCAPAAFLDSNATCASQHSKRRERRGERDRPGISQLRGAEKHQSRRAASAAPFHPASREARSSGAIWSKRTNRPQDDRKSGRARGDQRRQVAVHRLRELAVRYVRMASPCSVHSYVLHGPSTGGRERASKSAEIRH